MELRDKLSFFQNMINCCHNLYFGCYDSDHTLLYSSCPEEWQTFTDFFIRQNMELLQLHFQQNSKPLIIGNEYNMLWIVVPEEQENGQNQFHTMDRFLPVILP